MRPRLEQAPHGCCRSHLSLAKLKRARLYDGYRARTFGVCKGRRKAGLCLCVDLAADADVEHCRPWCDWIESSTSYAAIWVCPKRNCPLVRSQTVSQPLQEEKERSCLAAQTERQWRKQRVNDSPTVRPSASTVRAPPTMPAPYLIICSVT